MGGFFSSEQSNSPSAVPSPDLSPSSSMSASNSNPQRTEPKSSGFETRPLEPADARKEAKAEGFGSDQSNKVNSGEEEQVREDMNESVEGEEEQGECGFCLYMKAGGCRDSFIAWENCVEEAEKNKEDIVEKCFEVTGALKKCMEAHADYYEPILKAEKVAQEEAIIELEKEDVASRSFEQMADPKDVEDNVKNKNSSND